MTRELLIKSTLDSISKLPDNKIQEVSDYAEFLLSKLDDQIIASGIQKLIDENSTYQFLTDEEEIYTVNDLKERYCLS
ncbi:MAG: DUF2281 domain-containing protein [Cyclobacteriaceae bacterium]|nr:DUF2281 domain-containing protein [Cyclobacteriaceae bacterium]